MYELFIARRYLRAKRQIPLVTAISAIATIGVTIGVAALICALAVFNGFSGVVTSLLVGFDPHVRIEGAHRAALNDYAAVEQAISMVPQYTAYAPYVEGRVAVMHRGNLQVITLRGSDSAIAAATGVAAHTRWGNFDLGESWGLHGIVLGALLADRLRLTLGDTVTLVSPAGLENTLTQFAQPQLMRFRLTGIFSSATKDYDSYYGYTSLGAAQTLLDEPGKIDGVEMRLRHIRQSGAVKEQLQRLLAAEGVNARVLTWFDLHKDLYSVMEIERWAAYILLCLIIAVAAFTILGSLTMTVIEKQRDIGVLKAAGASDRSVQKIFVFAGALIGCIGVLCGSALGWLLCYVQQTYGVIHLDGAAYIISALPVQMRAGDFFAVGVAGLALCSLAAVYPAKRAARIVPAEALRWE